MLVPVLALNAAGGTDPVTVATDQERYACGETVRIRITNDTGKTYVWTGPCSFILERYDGRAWETSPEPYSGCALCGHQRELPSPLFLGAGATDEMTWDQKLSFCEEGALRTERASGRFRFVFRYAEDGSDCRSAEDPFDCWVGQRNKRWRSSRSNEFSNTPCGPGQL